MSDEDKEPVLVRRPTRYGQTGETTLDVLPTLLAQEGDEFLCSDAKDRRDLRGPLDGAHDGWILGAEDTADPRHINTCLARDLLAAETLLTPDVGQGELGGGGGGNHVLMVATGCVCVKEGITRYGTFCLWRTICGGLTQTQGRCKVV